MESLLLLLYSALHGILSILLLFTGEADMAIQPVRDYFKQLGMEEKIREFDVSSATVELAALAVGVEGARIAKTLSFHQDGGCILILAAGDAKIDNKKFKAQFGMKARMLSGDEVEALTGHAIGGVCPFAVKDTVKGIYLDESLRRFETVFPACGSSNSAIELNCEDLYRYSHANAWVDVCKLPDSEA